MGSYVWRHVRHLLAPALALLLTWVVLGAVAELVYDLTWIRGVVLLVISPLWFLGVYVVLIVLVPVSSWLHRRFDVLVPVWLGGIAVVVDGRGPFPGSARTSGSAPAHRRGGSWW